ncbi:MAG: signal recognition particle-docking protein FtsY [Candidatus Tectomicrobia bacterium]|uniref:Signal recognition particle receptor FtsY n=1 Tax=Tectimicrobiota bacterium TaxID=2528274 RepID=A0A933LQB7_UNCTE|nr:signal recognition particle-docking protein FtsY [Candidatus Tectomicrobia bacterium]
MFKKLKKSLGFNKDKKDKAEELNEGARVAIQDSERKDNVPPSEEQTAPEPPPAEPATEKAGLLGWLKKGLAKTRTTLVQRVENVLLGKKEIDAELLEELEEVLVTADLGIKTVEEIIKGITESVQRKELKDPEQVKAHIKAALLAILKKGEKELDLDMAQPVVMMIIGVNGVGKTTTIGKLAHRFQSQGRSVLLAAADTFRAAAIEQLAIWGERVGADLVKHKSGADPSAVVFDALQAAKARKCQVVITDTAGRLHTKVNLMEELKKIKRVAGKEVPGAPHYSFLVLDATTGQNAISQAKLFNEAVNLDGIILTKLDGTSKGGVLVSIINELNLPICYIGLGEGLEDLREFKAEPFVDALFE